MLFGSLFLIFLNLTNSEYTDFLYINTNKFYFICFTLMGFLFNMFVNFGVFLIDPLYISVGLLFGLPVNLIYDKFLNNYSISIK